MLFNLNRLVASISIAALTLGVTVAALPAQKANAQVSGIGSGNVGDLFTRFGANYTPAGSGVCASGTVPDGYDFCATDIPFAPADGYTIVPVTNLRIEAPVDPAVGVTGLDQGTVCSIYSGAITNWSNLGGPDEPIVVVYRLPGSGTGYIINNACGADGSQVPGAIGARSSGEVVNDVANTPGAIGYVEQANLNGLPSAVSPYFTGPIYVIYDLNNTDVSDLINLILSNPAPEPCYPVLGFCPF